MKCIIQQDGIVRGQCLYWRVEEICEGKDVYLRWDLRVARMRGAEDELAYNMSHLTFSTNPS